MSVNLKLFTYHQAARNVVETAAQMKASLEILRAAELEFPAGDHVYAAEVDAVLRQLVQLLPSKEG